MLDRNKLYSAIVGAGLTSYKLAERIGMSKNTFSNKMNGKGCFDIEQIDSICGELGIEDDLLKVQIFLSPKSQNRDSSSTSS